MLKHLPLEDSYFIIKESEMRYYEGNLAHSNDRPRGIVAFLLDDGFFDDELKQGGMETFILMLLTTLFELTHNDLEADIAATTDSMITEFETGRFDDLFPADELTAIKADISTVKEYLAAHPELLLD